MDKMDKSSIKYMEEISLNAWPSHKSELYDGWIIRYSHNYTYRTNSVEQVGASSIPIDQKIAFCENAYRHHGTPANFKINPLTDPAFDKMLEDRGYVIKHITEVMTGDLDKMHPMTPAAEEYDFENRLGMPSCMRFAADNGENAVGGVTGGAACDEIAVLIQPEITDEWIQGLFHLNGT